MVSLREQKCALAHLEEYLDVPAFSIDADDVLFTELRVRCDERNPVLAVVPVAHADNPGVHRGFTSNAYLHGQGKKILRAPAAFPAGSIDFLYVLHLSLEAVTDFRTALDHRDHMATQGADVHDLARIGKPTVHEDILRFVPSLYGSPQKLDHDFSRLRPRHHAALVAEAASVEGTACPQEVFFVRRGKQGEVDGKEGASVRPSESQKTEPLPVLPVDMVENTRCEFCPLVTCPLVERVVDDEAVVTVIRGQGAQIVVHDPLGKERREPKPIGMHILEEAIVGVLREVFPETSDLVLHVKATVSKGVAKNVGEQFHGRYPLELCDRADSEKLGNTKSYEEEPN